ncbi:hypothetical protein HPB50_024302 [Hyalomma asiaticum]|uniref:Uncharacterized protein n=1 Tax=Hyalomma asiaticum TaxID=266040 RepID=A0ACB7RQ64_HYAAI|nr:hypothetical protein HPB50_024302 [Hyalomma asiaticum]
MVTPRNFSPQKALCYVPSGGIQRHDFAYTGSEKGFDALTRTQDVQSLNDCVAKAQNFTSGLPRVLLRFGPFPIAINSGTLKVFFHLEHKREQNVLRCICYGSVDVTGESPIDVSKETQSELHFYWRRNLNVTVHKWQLGADWTLMFISGNLIRAYGHSGAPSEQRKERAKQ